MSNLTLPIEFPSPNRKPVVADFDGGNVSSNGGLALLAKADRKLGLMSAIAAQLKDERDPSRVEHSYLDLLRQRTFGIALGYEDANDANLLRNDPMMKLACERMPDSGAPLGSQASVSRVENLPSTQELDRIEKIVVRNVVRQLSPRTRKVIIDADPTDDPCHGCQEGQAYNGYYGANCFLPLFMHITAEDGRQRLLVGRLRPGNAGATKDFGEVLEMAVGLLRERFPRIRITLRADGAFGNAEVLALCHRMGIAYILGLRSNERVEKLASPFEQKAIERYQQGDDDCLLFGDFSYGAKNWKKEERVIIKGDIDGLFFRARYLVTNLGGKPEKLYAFYSKRGEHENRIKEMKLDLQSGRTSCHSFDANRFRLLLHVAACILLTAVQDAAAGTQWAKTTLGRFRLHIMKLAAQVVQSTRRVKVSFPSSYPEQAAWRRINAQLST